MTELMQLTDEQRRVLQSIYDRFRERGAWPTFAEIDRPLRKLGLRPELIIAAMPPSLLLPVQVGRSQPIGQDDLCLTLSGIAACDGGPEDIELFLRLVPWLAARELDFVPDLEHPGALLRVARHEIAEFLQVPEEAGVIARLREIITLQRWGFSGGGSKDGEWYLQVDRSIYRFGAVRTLDDYLTVMETWENEGKRVYTTVPDSFYAPIVGIADPDVPAAQPDQ